MNQSSTSNEDNTVLSSAHNLISMSHLKTFSLSSIPSFVIPESKTKDPL